VKPILRKLLPLGRLTVLVSALALGLAVLPAGAIIDVALQMQLGNPTGATADTNNHDHYLIQRSVETIDYSDRFGQPNWASWDLTAADVGSSGRSPNFYSDTNLPASFNVIPSNTYGSVGGQSYDRGHMCPSADRTDTIPNNELVFIMSNIIPQASQQNQKVWGNFETYCRGLLSTQELLIMCGPYNFGPNTVDGGLVGIASNTWKIVVGVPLGSGTALSRITNANPNSIRVIALEIPNTDAAGPSNWTTFVTSTRQIQDDTGYNFFSALPNNLAWVLRSKVDGQASPVPDSISFAPASGALGASVTITGTNLDTITNITFNGAVASFTITSPTQISAIVPASATSGTVTVRGLGGNATSSSSFTVSSGGNPDLAISCTHTGNFTQGDTGHTYTLIVTNVGSAAASGTITVTNTLPTGLSATAISGTGWTTSLGDLTGTRSDGLAAGAAYPPILVTVSVASNAPASITNIVTVSGGGDTNHANNTASDPTAVNIAAAPTVNTAPASAISVTSATLNGTVNPNGQPAAVQFQYGTNLSYGSVALVSGSVTGFTAQAVSTSLTGLLSGVTYHFRVSATNILGSNTGLDQTFATEVPGVADLTIAATHTGSFTQGDPSDTYTLIVTNAGVAASSGAVMVVDTLPAGLTATAISGAGWVTNLGTLTASRSDALAAGAAYPPITITVAVAANAAASVTNVATVSGGGDASPANNTASDPTAVNPAAAPTVATTAATAVGSATVTLNGTVNPNSQAATAHFDYGLTTNYGAVAAVTGTFTGATAQAASANITGLTAGTLYHFRVAATNVLGLASGLDQTFTTSPAPVPDLAITTTHSGSFTQGDTADTYTITVTNVGSAASSGTVTVVDTLPTGLTATAISGTGWTTNLATLTCTRSDALLAGAGYPAITVTVKVATNAAATVTNTVTVSGGGDSNPANNIANDLITINLSSGGSAITLVGWDMHALPGGLNDFGPSPMSPTTNSPNLTIMGLTRGSGVGTNANPAAARAWGGNNFQETSSTAAATANRFATFAVAANSGFKVSYTSVAKFDYRRSGTGPANGILQYQVGSGGFLDITNLAYTVSTSSGASLGPFDLSGISPLQNVGAGTNITFRIVNWGGTTSGGSWYIFDVLNSAALDFEVQGTVSPVVVPVSDLAVAVTHAASFTQGDPSDTYTITVTNLGTAATVGQVSVTDLLPAGLTATAIGGSGWAANLGALTCTRSDALAPGASYPPINIAVSVAFDAPASVTNIATVSGGGESNLANNAASDPTTVIAAAVPTVATDAATAIGITNATLNGTVNPNSQPASVHFSYGLTTNYGSTASVAGTLAGATGQAVSANITGLAAGTVYHFRAVATNVLGLAAGLDQTFTTATAPVPDFVLAVTHTGSFTQADTGDTYTITVTNAGNAASSGTVTVVDTLPTGLIATAIGGAGWITNLEALTCSRSDALAPGSAYPPITITVSVATNAPASVTNFVSVSGGGDLSPANNAASDPTSIIPLEPIELWRLQWFGTTADSGAAADTNIAPNGSPNLLNFALGLNPLVPTNSPVLGDIDTGYLRLTVPRNPNATDVSFFVELTDTLVPSAWSTNGTVVVSNAPALLEVRSSAPVASSAGGFMRLRVSRP